MNPWQHQLDWLIKMARIPGAKDHAWYRAKELEATGQWNGLCEALTMEMKKSEVLTNQGKP